MWLIPAIGAIFLGTYEIIYGIRLRYVSGFNFYMMAGLMKGLPFYSALLFSYITPDYYLLSFGIFLIWGAGQIWQSWREQQASRNSPREWQQWQDIQNRATILDKLLFYRGFNFKTKKTTSV
jgi:hypothetical protein